MADSISASVLMLELCRHRAMLAMLHVASVLHVGLRLAFGGLLAVQSAKQIGPTAFQRRPHAVEVIQRHVGFSRLDSLKIPAAHIGQFTELFLRDPAVAAEATDVPGNDDVGLWLLRWHSGILKLATFLVGPLYMAF